MALEKKVLILFFVMLSNIGDFDCKCNEEVLPVFEVM